jgi:hypothetical protein
MERFNGELRQREKVMRTGYHNYIRPHEALQGKTPSELVGIEVKGKDKWLTIIQNASKNA